MSFQSIANHITMAYYRTTNTGTRSYGTRNTGTLAEHSNTLAEHTNQIWRNNRNTTEQWNMKRAAEQGNNKTTPRNNTNTERRHIEQTT